MPSDVIIVAVGQARTANWK